MGACALAVVIACGGSGKGAEEAGKGKGGGEVNVPPAGDDDDDGGGGGSNGGEVGDNGGGNLNAIPPDKGGGPGPDVKPDPGGGKPTGAAPAALKTSESPVKMSEMLVKPAKEAEQKRNWALAVTYYQALVEARGPASAEAAELAMRWVDAGEYARAVDVLNEYINSTGDPAERAKKVTVRDNLLQTGLQRNPFSKDFVQQYATADAVKIYDLGRKAFKAKKYADAELYFRMGARLDPNLKGFLRELGATYDKLGMREKKIYFYREYVTRSPFGDNAEFARGELGKEKGVMGKLSMKSALPCDGGVWLNAVKLPPKLKLPMKDLPMPPGRHKALCWNVGYEIAHFEVFDVEAGKTKNVSFNWAVVVNDLSNPHGRIWLEDVTDPKREMRQLLLKNGGIGVPVPADGRPMKYKLQSMDRTVTKDNLLIRIAPGTVEHIKWP